MSFLVGSYLGLGLVRNWEEYATHGGAGDDNIHDYNHDTYVMMKCVSHEKCSLSVKPSTAEYSTVQYSTVQQSTAEYSRVQHSKAQYSRVQHSTTQYSRVEPNQIVWYRGLGK